MLAALPVAAAAPLRPLLTAATSSAGVALVGHRAAYLVVDDAAATVVAVVAPDATAPPCAVVLPKDTDPRDVLPEGSSASLGDGRLRCRGGDLVVRRWWSPPVLPSGFPDPAAVARAEALLAAAAPDPRSARRRALAAAGPAARALAAGDVERALAQLLPVIGLGPGSTPSGDDVTAGVLLGARACGAPPLAVRRAAATVTAAARGRTTAVSAGLLSEAAAGRGTRTVVEMQQALLGLRDVEEAVLGLVAVGDTSGVDIATGLCAAAAALAAVPTTRRRSA